MLSKIIKLLLLPAIAAEETKVSLKDIYDASKQHWLQQFAPFEEKGFTKEMIQGARELYHAEGLRRGTSTEFEFEDQAATDGVEMVLWTVIDGTIYIEESPYKEAGFGDVDTLDWFNGFRKVVKDPRFPKKVQFWTRVGSSQLNLEHFDNKRVDLEHP